MALSNRTILVAVVAAIIVIVVVVAVAMSLGANNPSTNPPTTGTEVKIVSQGYNFAFEPSSLTVHVGDNVTWVNNAGTDHTVVSDNATDPFSSGVLMNGQSYTHQFNQAGVFDYHCSIHPDMKGTITVTA
jgi:plastocyanin